MILPSITGTRLPKNPSQVTAWAPGALSPKVSSNMAKGMRYMLATLCSNPAATNADIGKTMATALSMTLRPAKAIHTAMQTRTLQSTPLKKAVEKGSATLAAAIRTYSWAIAPSFISACRERKTSTAKPVAPMKLPAQTIAQFRSKSRVLIFPSAQAIARRLFPVNSSAPATTTRISPRENATPPSACLAANPREGSDLTITKYNAPRPMKAPAKILSINIESSGRRALATPIVSTFAAISLEEKASKPKISDMGALGKVEEIRKPARHSIRPPFVCRLSLEADDRSHDSRLRRYARGRMWAPLRQVSDH